MMITVLSPTTSVDLGISSVFRKVLVLPTTRLSITGSTWSPGVTVQSCSTRTRVSVTSRRNRSWYLKKCAEGALEGIFVKGRFRRPVVGDWHHFSILNDQRCPSFHLYQLAVFGRHPVRPRRSDITRWRLLQGRPEREVGRTLSFGGFFQVSSGAVAFAWQQRPLWGSGGHEVARLLWHFKLPHTNRGWFIKKHGSFDMLPTPV